MSILAEHLALAHPIRLAVAGQDLSEQDAFDAVSAIMQSQATPTQVAALLIALAAKGETAAELAGAAAAMRKHCVRLQCDRTPLLDVCGTGGDGSGTFNISTASAFVVAGAGATVAKHGNRAMSSICGSADVLEALGANVWMPPERAAEMLQRVGIAFLFAQQYHPALKHVATVRREIGVRTLFNLIGPLANPANLTHQIVGVAHARALPLMAEALQKLGCRRGAVVRSQDGLDEVSLSASTDVIEWDGEKQRRYIINPQEFGFALASREALAGGNAAANALALRAVLRGERSARRDVVVLNAAIALYVCDTASTLQAGVTAAQDSIDSGAAYAKMQALIEASKA